MNKMKDSISQFQQSLQQLPTNQANNQFKSSSPPQAASSLDYLYQAISLIETKNNNNTNATNTNSSHFFNINSQQQQVPSSNQYIGNSTSTNGGMTKGSMNLMTSAAAHQNLLNQQSLINTAINNEQTKRYNSLAQQFTSNDQMNQLYQQAQAMSNGQQQNQNQSADQMDQSQFSVVDCRRYFNNLMYQQQLQKAQQQQGNCTDPYCNCMNKSTLPKYNTIHNIIGQQQQHHNYQQQQQMSNLGSSLQKLSKSPSLGKVTKQQQRRSESERANERRISNLIQLSQKSATTSTQIPSQSQSQAQSKKNISKLLQTGSLINDMAIINNENDFLTKKATPSRLEKAKQLARKHQNSLKLNLNTPDLQIIERDGLLTPSSSLSTSSVSPMSQGGSLSPISPQYSPTNQFPDQGNNNNNSNSSHSAASQPSVFNYYPVEMMNNLIPLYLSPYLNNLSSTPGNGIPSGSAPMTPTTPNSVTPNFYQVPTPSSTGLATSNIDQLYFQNLVTAIYTIANYQQQIQQPINSNQNGTNGLNLQRQSSLLSNLSTFNNGKQQNNIFNMGATTPQTLSHQQHIQPKATNNYPIQSAINSHLTSIPAQHRATDLMHNKSEVNNKPKNLSLNLKENKLEPIKTAVSKQSMNTQKIQPMTKKAQRSTFSYKLISYIGADIEGKVDEHFRRSLGNWYSKPGANLPTTQSTKESNENKNSTNDKNDSEQTKSKDTDVDMNNNCEETSSLNAKTSHNSSETKLVINELEEEDETNAHIDEEKNKQQSKDWNKNNNNIANINSYCYCNNYDCSHLEAETNRSTTSIPDGEMTISSKTSPAESFNENTASEDSQEYEELVEYDTYDENLIDYSNDGEIASNPVSPVSTASYSYSVISQTSDMIPEESASQTVDAQCEQPVMDVMSNLLANKQIISSS